MGSQVVAAKRSIGLKETSIGICMDKCISFFQPGCSLRFDLNHRWRSFETGENIPWPAPARELNLLYKLARLIDAARSNRAGSD